MFFQRVGRDTAGPKGNINTSSNSSQHVLLYTTDSQFLIIDDTDENKMKDIFHPRYRDNYIVVR